MKKYQIKDALTFLITSGNSDLTVRQLSVFLACKEADQPVGALAIKLGVHKPVVSRAGDKLQKMKFITRKTDSKDHRIVSLCMTAKGRKFADNFE